MTAERKGKSIKLMFMFFMVMFRRIIAKLRIETMSTSGIRERIRLKM